MVPDVNIANQRRTISVTGGKTYGFTQWARVTSSQIARTIATGRTLMSKGMPSHEPAQAGEVEAVEEVAERRQPDHHREHGVVRADAAIGKDKVAQSRLGRDELRAHQDDDRDGDR